MDLVQKNIHFNRMTKEARNQITLEEDINIPDVKEDIEEILLTKPQVVMEDIKTGEQKIYVRGKLQFSILYKSEETGRLCSLTGSMPIEEQLYMEDVHNADKVMVKSNVEDFQVGMINSRKISIQSVLDLYAYAGEIYDEEITVGINGVECEMLSKECEFSQLTVCKKDTIRIRENVTIPNNMPNVEELIFSSVNVCDVEYKAMDGQISIQGKIAVFLLYDGERDNKNQMYQTMIPFALTKECSGSNANTISQISYNIADSQVRLETDYDEEPRSFSVDIVLALDMKMYEPQKVNVLSDLYGIQKEIIPIEKEFYYDVLKGQYNGNIKVGDKLNLGIMEKNNMKIVHSEGNAILDTCEMTKDGMVLKGVFSGQVLYLVEGEEREFSNHYFMIPFEKKIEELKEMKVSQYYPNVHCKDMQFSFDMEGKLDVAGNIGYSLLVFENVAGKNIVNVDVKERDTNKLNQMPSMAVCFVSSGDTLWSLGKKYCVPTGQIREMNHLLQDEVNEGDKILIVRG